MTDVPVQINLRNGRGEILVDGHDIARAVTGFEIRSTPGESVQLTLELPTLEWSSDKATVLFIDDVRDALISMGWTPPAEDA